MKPPLPSNEMKKKLSCITVPSSPSFYYFNETSSSLQTDTAGTKSHETSPKKQLCRNRHPKIKSFFLMMLLLVLTGFVVFSIFTLLNHPCALAITRILSENKNFILENRGIRDDVETEFWTQPDGMGYRPCLQFSDRYRKETVPIMEDRRKFLTVIVNGGLNQQRNQIVDAVVIARILGAALVIPIMRENVVWEDDSEFNDIFDYDHFKKTLADDVRVVATLPWFHTTTSPVDGSRNRFNASPKWFRRTYLKKMNQVGVLLLRSYDSRLSKNLPSDLQKLRCKAAFLALRFTAPIMELGNRLTERMRSKGPYLALHLRMEEDVWVRSGCLPGLTKKYDDIIHEERKKRPELLSGRNTLNFHDRKVAGLCPLTSVEITRLLKALEAPRNTRIYWAGGEPLGGDLAMKPILDEFPYMYNKENISLPGELDQFAHRASILAALDFIVAENSDVFMQSHGGNMGRALQGRRTFFGQKKHIVPQKRQMIQYFLNKTIPESEFNIIVKSLHSELIIPRIPTKDVTSHPIPDCMCNSSTVAATTTTTYFHI